VARLLVAPGALLMVASGGLLLGGKLQPGVRPVRRAAPRLDQQELI